MSSTFASSFRDLAQCRSVGIITYDTVHLKTEQVVHRLLARNRLLPVADQLHLKIIALPFQKRPERSVLFSHRPDQTIAIHPKALAAKYQLPFSIYDASAPLELCDLYVITGAGILSSATVAGRKIINAHPGIIPTSRGLDSFKWAIHDGVPLGVSLHFIDEKVDEGQLISVFQTPVYETDTLQSLARRHYELEIDVLSDYQLHLNHPQNKVFPEQPARMRMPVALEAQVLEKFDAYKAQYAVAPPVL